MNNNVNCASVLQTHDWFLNWRTVKTQINATEHSISLVSALSCLDKNNI